MNDSILTQYTKLKNKGLNIDITRGKPESTQLDLSNTLLNSNVQALSDSGVDLRNYGEPYGLDEARSLGAEILNAPKENIIAAEQSSLLLTYQTFLSCFLFGFETPWKNLKSRKFICPVPGFDRHFKIFEDFDIEVIPVPLYEDGIEIDSFKDALNKHDDILGMLSVPRHSNPSGETFSDENILDLFKYGKAYSKDFLFIFDNAYLVHDFLPTREQTPIWVLSEKSKCTDTTVIATSFSKVTFGGGGLSFVASGTRGIELLKRIRTSMIICPDKINQQRHLNFLPNLNAIKNHMKKHADIVKPKFELIYKYLDKLPNNYGSYSKPTGGYFVSYKFSKPIASTIVKNCSDLGVEITPADALFPKGKNPNNILRIAPTYIDLESLNNAMQVFNLATTKAFEET